MCTRTLHQIFLEHVLLHSSENRKELYYKTFSVCVMDLRKILKLFYPNILSFPKKAITIDKKLWISAWKTSRKRQEQFLHCISSTWSRKKCMHTSGILWLSLVNGQSAKNMEHFFKLSGPHGSELLTLKGLRFEDEDDYEYKIFSKLSIAHAWASVILAGKQDSCCHSTKGFSKNNYCSSENKLSNVRSFIILLSGESLL